MDIVSDTALENKPLDNKPIEVILLNDIASQGGARLSRYVGPYVIASSLEKQGIRTLVIENFTYNPSFFDYLKNFLSKDIKAIGISSTFLSRPIDQGHDWSKSKLPRSTVAEKSMSGYLWFDNAEQMVSWTGSLKSLLLSFNPKAKLVLGGAKTALIWKHQKSETHDSPYRNFDFLVHGAAEESFKDFVVRLKEESQIESVEKGSVKFLKPVVVDQCPTTFFNHRNAVRQGEGLPIEISRGCLFNCKFCYYEKQFSKIKSSTHLKAELFYNYNEFGTTTYHFCDDCFNDHPKKVESVCETILSLPFKIEWISYARVDVSVRFPHLLPLMIESGCRGLWWGIETFNHRAGMAAGKGLDPALVKEHLLSWRSKFKESCLFQGSFIVGLPHETPETQLQTLDFVLNNDILDFASFGTLGILDYDETLDGELFEFDYSEYSRDPEKYGFSKVQFNPYFWQHQTMNLNEANVLTKTCIDAWYQKRGMTAVTSIWTYPILKSLGFSKSEIFRMARETEGAPTWTKQLIERRAEWDQIYFKNLLEENRVINSKTRIASGFLDKVM